MNNYEYLLKSNPKAELARRNILDFVKYVTPFYDANWHHILLCNYLDRFVKGEIKRLIVTMPPQHGKSQLVSRSLPAFILGKNPNKKIVLASYSADLSSSFNRDCQRIMNTKEYCAVFPNTRLSTASNLEALRNSEYFQIPGFTGYLKTVGVGGALTGNTADIAIIDDPVKDSLEAMSATYQLRNWNWYNDVLYTRIHNDSGILITQTRWDERDLTGLVLKSMEEGRGEQWTILNLPAVKENDDNIEDPRQVGEALWPKKHDLAKLNIVKNQNIRTFQSLYQQNPKPTETGGEFYKQFKIHRNVKDIEYNPSTPLHVSFDFNVNPGMHAVVFQVEGKKAYQIKEVVCKAPRNNTKGICDEFKRLYPSHRGGLFIYGDPSGMNQDTRREDRYNDFDIICHELKDYYPDRRLLTSHPSVRMRGNFINTLFEVGYSGVELWINSKCKTTIDDLLYLKEDSDGSKLKEKSKDLGTGVQFEKYGHCSDAIDYFVCKCFDKEYAMYQRNGLISTEGMFSVQTVSRLTM